MPAAANVRLFLQRLFLFLLPLAAALGAVEARLTGMPNAYTHKKRLVDELAGGTSSRSC